MAVKLEIQVWPQRAEEQNHHYVHQEVKGQNASWNHFLPFNWVDENRDDDNKWEIAEPHHIHDHQTDVEPQCKCAILNEIHLPHFVQNVEEEKQAVGKIEPSSPRLEIILGLSRKGVDLILDLGGGGEYNEDDTLKISSNHTLSFISK